MQNGKQLIYVGDPMCSWCYGFAPIKGRVEEQCRGRVETRLVVGGLHIDWTEPQDNARKQFLREHWLEIGERSGQPFKFDILERNDFVYNTEASCRAAVTARVLAGEEEGLGFFTVVQRAFYAENRDITKDDVLIDLAEEFGLQKETFAQMFDSPEMRRATQDDFDFARRLGVTGFPTMLVKDSLGYKYLTIGYREYEFLQPIIEEWICG